MAQRSDARPIPGFAGFYATQEGTILDESGRELALCKEYPRVLIQREGEPRGQRRRYGVHQLVAAAFLGPRPDGHDIDHIDGDPQNSKPSNLRYETVAVNRARHGRPSFGPRHNANKTHCKRGHVFDEANTKWDKRGRRQCRACQPLFKTKPTSANQ